MKTQVPADVRAVWASLGNGMSRRALVSNLAVACFVIPFVCELMGYWLLPGTAPTQTTVAVMLYWTALRPFARRKDGDCRWIPPDRLLSLPMSTSRLVVSVFLRVVVLPSLFVLAAYAAAAGTGLLRQGQPSNHCISFIAVATPAFLGGLLTGGSRLILLVVAVVLSSSLSVSPILNTGLLPGAGQHGWFAICFAASLALGLGFTALGVRHARRGVWCSGRRVVPSPPSRRKDKARARAPFTTTRQAENWRQWRVAWYAIPLGTALALLFAVFFASLLISLDGNRPLLVKTILICPIIGLMLGAAAAGWRAIGAVSTPEWMAIRTRSSGSAMWWLQRATAVSLVATVVVAAPVILMVWVIAAALAGVVPTVPGLCGVASDPAELARTALCVGAGLWSVVWIGTLLNRGLLLFGVTVGMALIAAHACGLSLNSMSLPIAGAAAVFAVGSVAYGVRVFHLAWRQGVVSSATCWKAGAAWIFLLALLWWHHPAWMGSFGAPMCACLVVWITTGVVVPTAGVPLVLRGRRPCLGAYPLLTWSGYIWPESDGTVQRRRAGEET